MASLDNTVHHPTPRLVSVDDWMSNEEFKTKLSKIQVEVAALLPPPGGMLVSDEFLLEKRIHAAVEEVFWRSK